MVEHTWPVLDELDAAVEGAALDHGEAVILRGKDHRHVAGSKVTANLAFGFLPAEHTSRLAR
jgi:hypothetical protein